MKLKYGDGLFYYAGKPYRKIFKFFFQSFYAHLGIYIGNGQVLHITMTKNHTGHEVKPFDISEDFHLYRFKIKWFKGVIEKNLKLLKRYPWFQFPLIFFIRIARMLKLNWFQSRKYTTCNEFFVNCLKDAGCVLKKGLKDIPSGTQTPDDSILLYECQYIPKEKIEL